MFFMLYVKSDVMCYLNKYCKYLYKRISYLIIVLKLFERGKKVFTVVLYDSKQTTQQEVPILL